MQFTDHECIGRPPHAPHIAPIEFAFSFIKGCLNKRGRRFADEYELTEAVEAAILSITTEMCYNWFINCGYTP